MTCASLLTEPWQQPPRTLRAVRIAHAPGVPSMLNPNVPAWFEIPADDLDRAQSFYERVLAVDLTREDFGGGTMAVFPCGGKPHASGALVAMEDCTPSVLGSIVYLSVADLAPALERANAHGGDTLVPRTALPEGMGYFAQFRDCEGNRVGLWSPV
jgi:predicted enzyme related to lactoylglutathione lyase